MGSRGPAKQPASLQQLHGNPGHRKNGEKITYKQSPDVPKSPDWLGKIAKKEWSRLAPVVFEARILTEADIAVFAAYCASYEQWVQAEKVIAAKKLSKDTPPQLTYETEKGVIKPVPEIGIANEAKKQMLQFAREFGMTPASRSNISAVESEDAPSSIMEFMRCS